MERLKKERAQLEAAASKLLSLATKAGATDAEVCGTFSLRTKIALEKQDFHLASAEDGYQLGLRVLVGKKQGFASTNTLEASDLKELAARAVEIAQFSPENPYQVIIPSENVPREAPSNLWDDSIFQVSLKTQKDWTKLMADEAIRDPRFRLNDGGLTIGASLFLVVNTKGTQKLERETYATWSLMGMAVDGSNITSLDYFQELARTKTGIQERMLQTTRRFRDSVLANLVSGAGQSYKGQVIFSPRAVDDILISPLTHHLNGRSVVDGTSRWKREQLGKKVISSQLTLRDLPWYSTRFGATNFDREGTPTRDRVLIEKGTLQVLLTDGYASQALEIPNTGHAKGNATAIPAVGYHSLSVDGGTEPFAKLVANVTAKQKGFLLVHRFSGSTDSITGDFSGVAKGAEWWENGKRSHFVKETSISGNFFECLGDNVLAVSKETEELDSTAEMPSLVVDGVSVTAG